MGMRISRLALIGCAALLLSKTGTSVAAEIRPLDTRSEQVADARREAQILTSYAINPYLRNFDLSVVVDGNKAMLDGHVQDGVAKELAEHIALEEDGIRHVDNRIVVDASYVPKRHTSSERSFSERASDTATTISVKSKLLWSAHVDSLGIHVVTVNGKVTLTGSTGSDTERSQAEQIARDTDGVIGVNDQITLTDKPSAVAQAKSASADAEQQASDTWITTKVKASLSFTRDVDGFDIKVNTRDRVVSLAGVVNTAAQRDLAVRVAEDVRGVKEVDAGSLKVD